MEGKTVVIKKVRKKGHEAAHGGAWKVAYADFATAMMAFFLLLWLITMVEPEKRARVSNYFKRFSIFEKTGPSFLDSTSRIDLTDIMNEKSNRPSETKRGIMRKGANVMSGEDFKEKLKKEIEAKLSDVQDQVLLETFEGGVRIQMVDKDGNSMFPLGSSELSPSARKILRVIAENLKDTENPVAIEGHTDAHGYSTNRYTNWELSTERASAARKQMEADGVGQDRLLRVAGFAATEPLIKENPYDPRNRRISVLLFYRTGGTEEAASSLLRASANGDPQGRPIIDQPPGGSAGSAR